MNDRRNFIKIFGTGLSGALFTSTNIKGQISNALNTLVKIGVILPQIHENSQYQESFLNGLKMGCKQIDNESHELITEKVKYGSPYQAAKKIEQLISENKVNLVVGLLSTEATFKLGEIAKKAKVPAIIANAGENYLSAKNRENPFLFFNSLNLYENSYLTGRYAVEKYGKNIAVVSSLFDSGYDSLNAFYKGVEDAGGRIVKTYIKEQHDNEFITKSLDNIQEKEVDSIYVLLNGNLANDFFRMAQIRNINLPLLSTSFATEENQLVHVGSAANGIESFCSWNRNLTNSENISFVSDYAKIYSIEPDQFSFLGYETGLIINASVDTCGNDLSGTSLVEAIKNCKVNSPGGKIFINKNTGQVMNPVYRCITKTKGFNNPSNEIIHEINIGGKIDESLASLDSDMRSGWLNPYPLI